MYLKEQKVMRIKPTVYAILALAMSLAAACDEDTLGDSRSELVVEGWIDSGGFPVVMLTRTVPISGDYQPLDSLQRYIERWATVRVSDGTREVTLTGTYNKEYFPPYIYTTSDMRGEPGKTYRLTVDCTDGTRAEAEAEVPCPVEVTEFSQQPSGTSDTLRQLYCHLPAGPSAPPCNYKVFVRLPGNGYGYMSAYLGITTTALLPGDGRMPVNNGRVNLEKEFTPFFTVGDTVMVKVAVVDDGAYTFWRQFEDMANLSRNPLFPVTDNMPTNIRGGMGYWFGYGADFTVVRVGQNGVETISNY